MLNSLNGFPPPFRLLEVRGQSVRIPTGMKFAVSFEDGPDTTLSFRWFRTRAPAQRWQGLCLHETELHDLLRPSVPYYATHSDAHVEARA